MHQFMKHIDHVGENDLQLFLSLFGQQYLGLFIHPYSKEYQEGLRVLVRELLDRLNTLEGDDLSNFIQWCYKAVDTTIKMNKVKI